MVLSTEKQELYLKELDISRRTVESLDRSMMTVRQLYFVVVGLLIGSISFMLGKLDLQSLMLAIQGITICILGFSITFWLLDSHYHRYLRSSVHVCTELELALGYRPDSKLALNLSLENTRKKSEEGKVIPLLLYLLPSGMMLALSFILNININLEEPGISYYVGLSAIVAEAYILRYWGNRIISFLEEERTVEIVEI